MDGGKAEVAVRYARKSAEAVDAMAELMGLATPEPRVAECFLPPDLFTEVLAACGGRAEADVALRPFFVHEGVVFFTRAGTV